MKVIKDTKTGLLLKSFLLENEDYLSVSVLYYFDFNNPDAPLEEQDMYKQTKELLSQVMLDYAMPKPKAEVLLCGNCHNYEPQSGASHVVLRVGEHINKELYVFGNRMWKNGVITKPLPFKTMPLDYAHAKQNGDLLPNVEDPKHLIASKDDKIQPATFLPTDIFSDENMKKLGTFDEAYKKELWPGFARDMDYSFFNVAPKDQIQDEFFKGGEAIEMLNMHPEKQLLASYIPKTTFRCFATKEHKEQEDEFREIKLQRDTLWLFPEIEKGIVIFRGTLKIADEIYSDVKYLNIKPVFEDDETKTPQQYYELQKKELKKGKEIDKAPFLEMEKKIAQAKKEIFDIPRQLKDMVLKTKGKKPVLEMTHEEKIKQSNDRIDDALRRIDDAKAKILKLKDEFGHISKIDTSSLERTRAELLETKEQLASVLQNVNEKMEQAKQVKLDALSHVQKMKQNPKIPDEKKDEIGLDFLEEKEKSWSDFAFEFLSKCVKDLANRPHELDRLQHLGLSKKTISRAWIGFNCDERRFEARKWGLEKDDEIILPKGLVTSRFREATLKALCIDDKSVFGSDESCELFLSEGNCSFPLFYFQDDLQAHLCDQEAYDICNSLACDDISKIGDEAKEALKSASVVFYLQENGAIEKLKNAKKFDCGEYKNLFELHQNEIDIREQIVKNLPDDIKDELPITRDVSAISIIKKSKEITNPLKDEIMAKAEKIKSDFEAKKDSMLKKANDLLEQNGYEPIEMDTKVSSKGFIEPSEVAQHFDRAIKSLSAKKDLDKIDIQEHIAKLEIDKAKMVALAKRGKSRYKEAMAKLEEAKQKAKNPIPKWAKDMMIKAGIDPDNPHGVALTREKVIQMYQQNKSFRGANLSGLDLSGLNLSGADFTQANCKETDFSQTDLSKTIFTQANCTKADFTKANFDLAKADAIVFKEAKFEQTNFGNIKANQAIFDGATMKESKFDEADLSGVVFKKATIQNSTFSRCNLSKAIIIEAFIGGSGFDDCVFEKPLFSKSNIDGCSFLRIDAKGMLFNKTKIVQCDFTNAKLYNVRLLKQSLFEKSNFCCADMQKSTIFEAFMSDCKLQKANLSKSMIRQSNIDKCDFRGVVAKGSRFEYAACKECDFVGIDLFKGSLRRMDLKICDFSDANLYGVEFYKTKFYEVKLDRANLKRSNLENREVYIYD